ncbi:hypothetical protein COY32_05900 [candidate division WWE3 bacterium CG_4_10_14_0_2_um_filter_41_14]|uniref:Uncharacterized protein n=1 Tax=candidate division WWE3 bacterium CG_4_10_14_0_2_um_filter_41_14 TaxID=1975072 RepID=A0A2M7TGN8_UNCKA|nr:MAG: hypothetical protein COY32_05900 [candidate division WWE3 bacterium CG_4_10_14_0_2_um_filter_41_14]
MQQDEDNKQGIIDKINTPPEVENSELKDWRNEHGYPSNNFLQSLADQSLEDSSLTGKAATEKLKSIATDLDVSFGPNTSIEELIGRIRAVSRSGINTTT